MSITKPTVLIADDDRGLVEALTIRLHAAGYHVVTSMDGDDTVAMAQGVQPAVIVLDINMPGGSGPEAQKMLQSDGDFKNTPVIYMTGASTEEIRQVSENLAPFAVLRKPFETDELIQTVQNAIDAFPPDG